jgi:hypothetical protein
MDLYYNVFCKAFQSMRKQCQHDFQLYFHRSNRSYNFFHIKMLCILLHLSLCYTSFYYIMDDIIRNQVFFFKVTLVSYTDVNTMANNNIDSRPKQNIELHICKYESTSWNENSERWYYTKSWVTATSIINNWDETSLLQLANSNITPYLYRKQKERERERDSLWSNIKKIYEHNVFGRWNVTSCRK